MNGGGLRGDDIARSGNLARGGCGGHRGRFRRCRRNRWQIGCGRLRVRAQQRLAKGAGLRPQLLRHRRPDIGAGSTGTDQQDQQSRPDPSTGRFRCEILGFSWLDNRQGFERFGQTGIFMMKIVHAHKDVRHRSILRPERRNRGTESRSSTRSARKLWAVRHRLIRLGACDNRPRPIPKTRRNCLKIMECQSHTMPKRWRYERHSGGSVRKSGQPATFARQTRRFKCC